jgi:hypothetical protein
VLNRSLQSLMDQALLFKALPCGILPESRGYGVVPMNAPNPANKKQSQHDRITAEQAAVDLSVTAVGGGDDYAASLVRGAPGDRLTQSSQGGQPHGVKGFNPYYRSQS